MEEPQQPQESEQRQGKSPGRIREVETFLSDRRWLSFALGLCGLCGAFAAWLAAPLLRMLAVIPCGMLAVAGLFAGLITLEKAQRSARSDFAAILGTSLCVFCILKVTGMAVWNALQWSPRTAVAQQNPPTRPFPSAMQQPAPVPPKAASNGKSPATEVPSRPSTPSKAVGLPAVVETPTKRADPPTIKPAVKPSAEPSPLRPISPTAFPLPGNLIGSAVAGGGRYLVLHIQQPRQLLLFDTLARRVVRSLELESHDVLFAAGYEHLLVLDRGQRLLMRYNLETFERQFSEILTTKAIPTQLAMGSGSSDLALVGAETLNEEGEFQLLDILTLRDLQYALPRADLPVLRPESRLTAAPDGQTFACSRISFRRQSNAGEGTACTLIPGGAELGIFRGTLGGDLSLDYRGGGLYHGGALSNRWGERVVAANPREAISVLPAADGPFELRMSMMPQDSKAGVEGRTADIYFSSGDSPLATVRGIQLDQRALPNAQQKPPLREQLVLLTEQSLLVNLVPGRAEIGLYEVPVQELLSKSPKDHLYLASTPRPRAEPKNPYRDRLRVRCSQGKVAFRLESGPPGLTISADGEVEWPNPEAAGTHHVVFSATSASGRTILETFAIRVGPRSPWPRRDQVAVNFRNVTWGAVHSAALSLGREVNPPPLTPPDLVEDRVRVSLPGALKEIVVGGAGRYLILEFHELDALAVFDVSQAKIVRYVNVGRRPLFAACIDKLFVVDNDRHEMARWDLQTFERELVAPLPADVFVETVAMGCASNGPALLGFHRMAAPVLIDLETLKHLDARPLTPHAFSCGAGSRVRASSNGRVFASWRTEVTPSGVSVLTVDASGYHVYSEHSSAGTLMPSPDGRLVLSSGRGAFNSRAQHLHLHGWRGWLPAVEGPYLMENTGGMASIFVAGCDRSLAQIDQLDGVRPETREFNRETFTADKRLFLIPKAKVLVSVDRGRDGLVLRKIDPDKAVESLGLFISSIPSPMLQPAEHWRYEVTARTQFPPVKIRLVKGPPDMKLSPEGIATWQGPPTYNPNAGLVPVEISVEDESGAKATQTFELELTYKR